MTKKNNEGMITVSKTRLEQYIHSTNLGCGYGNMNCAMPERSNTDCFYCKYSRLNYDEDLRESTLKWLKGEEE